MSHNKKLSPIVIFLLAISLFSPLTNTQADFSLNFQPNPNVVPSIANWGCNAGGGGGGMGGGGMMSIGPGCGSDYFLQEVIEDNGVLYYHVILGDPDQDDFAMEFYMRTGGCCWWPSGGGMGGGMGGGGSAPFSSSLGDINDRLANAWLPLGDPAFTGNGTGNPNRIYVRQINNDAQMTQEFIKDTEINKPYISQIISDGSLTSTFELDMRNGRYDAYSDPISFINKTTIAGIGSFDANADAPNANITAGRFIYLPGGGHGESDGSYIHEEGGFDIDNVDWLSYCEPEANPDHLCEFSRGGGGGMGGGGMGGGRGGRN